MTKPVKDPALQHRKPKATFLDTSEQLAKIAATVAIPIVLGVGGWVIQTSIETSKQEVDRQRISLEYVKMAKEILTSEKEVPEQLSKWSWQVIDSVSPRHIDPDDLKALIKGNAKIPPPAPSISAKPLKSEYDQLYKQMKIVESRVPLLDSVGDKIVAAKDRYLAVVAGTNIPWIMIAVVHAIECSGDFNRHLHNCDPLTARTVNFPRGRPVQGNPPFTWEDSAKDFIQISNFPQATDWDIASILGRLEQFNGYGYRRHNINTPYLWSCTNQYTKGKFVGDASFDPEAISASCGAAPILKRLIDRGFVVLN